MTRRSGPETGGESAGTGNARTRGPRRLLVRLGRGVAVATGLLLLVLATLLYTLTQTRPGREYVAGWLERRLEAAFPAEVEIGPILAGNLLTRAVLERFVIAERGGAVFVALDSVRLSYDPVALLRGNFSFRGVQARRGRLNLLQAADGTWNLDRIFAPRPTAGSADSTEAGKTQVVLSDFEVGLGHVTLRKPWAAGLTGAEYEAAVAAGLRGEALWRVEATGNGGYEQVVELEELRGRFPLLRIVHPDLPTTIRLQGVSAVVRAFQRPLTVASFDGGIVFGDTTWVRADRARLPASRLTGQGWITGADPVRYRFELEADPLGLADLDWLELPFPEEGSGPLKLSLFTRDGETLLHVAEGDVRVDDSRISGGFTLALADPPVFEHLDLRLRPLRLARLEPTLGRPPGIDGYVEGELSGAGPLSALDLRGSGTLRDVGGEAAPSTVQFDGAVSLVEPYELQELELRFSDFEPRWLRLAGLETALAGRIDGTLVLDGTPGARMAFVGALAHSRTGETTSRVSGSGVLELGEAFRVDVELLADPISLALLAPFFPDLGLVGSVRGPVSARGTLGRLEAAADLETPRGQLRLEGEFDLASERRRYAGRVTARGIDLRQWAEGWPETELAVTGRVEGEGTDPASLAARFDLEILPSVFQEARIDTSVLRFRLANGLATVDTFAVRTDVGRLRGRGGIGLTRERSGTLILDAEVDDLASWNRWLVPGRSGAGSPEEPEDLFARFPEPGGAAAGAAPQAFLPDTLRGRLNARGALFGNVEDFSFGGRLVVRDVGYGGTFADSLAARLDVQDPRTLDSLVVNLVAWRMKALGLATDSVALRLERLGAGPSALRLFAARDTSFALDLLGDVAWTPAEKSAALDRLRLRFGDHELALARPARVASGDSGLVARDFLLSGGRGERLEASGAVPLEGPAAFDLRFSDLHVGEILGPISGRQDVSGTLGGSLRLRGTARAPQMEAELQIEEPSFGPVSYSRLVGRFRYVDRRVTGALVLGDEARPLLRVEGDVRADLALRGAGRRLSEDAFDFRIRADTLPASVIELLGSSLREVDGVLRGEVRVRGEPGNLRLGGEAYLARGVARVPDLGIRFEDARGRAVFSGSGARLDSLVVRSGREGRGWITGRVELGSLRDPGLDLRLRTRGLQAVNRRRMSFLMTADGRLTGSYREPVLTGRARVFNGDVREEEFLRSQTIIDLTDPDVWALIDTAVVAERRLLERVQNPFMRNLRMDVQLDVGPDLWLRSDVLDVELEGEGVSVSIDRARNELVMFGSLRLLRGKYVLEGLRQQLRITGGTIEFVGEPGLNPNLSITAEYRTRTEQGPVSVQVLIGGTMRQTELAFRSDPPMSESDQLCFLALGSPCAVATDVRQADRIVRTGVLGTIGSGLSSALVGSVGVDYLTLRATQSEFEESSRFDLFSSAELEVGKYLGSDLFVTVTQPLGSRYPGWSIEWRFGPNWTLEARAENRFGRRFGLATGSSLEFDQTYGLFIFREWSF